MAYHYFADPHHFAPYSEEPRPCELCGRTRQGYDGTFYGVKDVEFVCDECLASGKLTEHNLHTNSGSSDALGAQLAELFPELLPEERQAIVAERTSELEERTPHLCTWQDFYWPVHCGDYCQYLKVLGQADAIRLDPDGDGKRFLETHTLPELYGQMWDALRPGSPKDNHEDYSPEFYLFQCQECGEYVIHWDCD